MHNQLRNLPSVDKLLQADALQPVVENYGHDIVVEAIRRQLAETRQKLLTGNGDAPSLGSLAQAVTQRLLATMRPTLEPVINATGVIIHTNLGRALLSRRAKAAMQQAAGQYSNLEYSLERGARGSRYIHAADLLCRLTGAEAAVVVNNNAGAVVLALTALAQGAEVIISRSQLVEIGGGFRIPDIMRQSGCKLVEVGATNRTYISDYEQGINPPHSGLLLTVHASNYQITGFTSQPALADLAALGQRHNLPLMEDLGSGTLLDTTPFGLRHEPTIQESLVAGVDVVTASGDKLLGGPQAGLILGRSHLIEQLKKHPLIRALRVDKTTLAALQATLMAYLEDKVVEELPVWQMISASPTKLGRRARRWQKALAEVVGDGISTQIVESVSTVGGGSLPGQTLPTKALAINCPSPDALAERLRQAGHHPPLISRIENDLLLLDPRTVLPEQDKLLVSALKAALQPPFGTKA